MSDASYLINEIYPCLQGEGAGIGTPSILVRFQICNLRCTWCDTPYTHTLKSDPIDASNLHAGQAFKRLSVAALAEFIRTFQPIRHLILTGGEPTLQNLKPLLALLGPSYTAEVESNGTQVPHERFHDFQEEDYPRFQWNISPKGRAAGQELVWNALMHWATLSRETNQVFFKFVIRQAHAAADLSEVLEIQDRLGLDRSRIFLMAEGTSVESQVGNQWLHDMCLAERMRYSPRLHVLLFGPLRGV